MSLRNELTSRRKLLAALAAIGTGGAAVSAGTYAAFSDSESDDSSLTTGDLTLDFDDSQSGGFSLSTSELRPGDSGLETVTLNNGGSLDGTLTVTLDAITNTDEKTTDPESTVSDGGRLSDALQIRLWLEPAGDSDSDTDIDGNSDEVILQPDGTAVIANNASSSEQNRKTADTFYDSEASSPSAVTWDGSTLPTATSGQSYNLLFDWSLPETADNLDDISDINAVMADSSTFEFTFEIVGT
jgi:predicted ribosomally synthesized peptide with SipW-like signal peptide